MRFSFRNRPKFATLAVALLVGIAGCSAPKDPPKGPPEVGYSVVHATTVPLSTTLPGRTSASTIAEVRPQISGVIERRLFTEGSLVRRGQPLYQIDASLLSAAADQARANLASAQASAAAAKAKADRYKPLAAEQAVSLQDYTEAAAAARTSAAAIAQTRAALHTAAVNLHYATVPAPISGRIGRSLVTVGALANAGQTSPLAVISALDPIYVDIQQSAADMLALRRQLGGGAVKATLKFDDGSNYPLPGSLEFAEQTVDPTTGTVTLRLRFANPQGLLLPGLFVRATLTQPSPVPVYVVPQAALTRDPLGNALVWLVDGAGHAVQRGVTAPRTDGSNWVVTAGLRDGDRLITQGLGKVKPGMPVQAVPDSAVQRPRGDHAKHGG